MSPMKPLIVKKGMSAGSGARIRFHASAFTMRVSTLVKKDLGSDRNFTDCSFLHRQFCMQRMKDVIPAVEYGGPLICSDAGTLALSYRAVLFIHLKQYE